MTSPVKALVIMIFAETKSGSGEVNSLEMRAMKAEGVLPACRLVQLVNVGHLKAPSYPNGIDDDGGFFVVGTSGPAAALLIARTGMRDMMKIHTGEPRTHGYCVDSRSVYNLLVGQPRRRLSRPLASSSLRLQGSAPGLPNANRILISMIHSRIATPSWMNPSMNTQPIHRKMTRKRFLNIQSHRRFFWTD